MKYVTIPVRAANPDIVDGVSFDISKGAISWGDGAKENVIREPTITKRTMRRLWASVWAETPKMSQDGITNKWVVTWGNQRSPITSGQVTEPSASDQELFEGLENAAEFGGSLRRDGWSKRSKVIRAVPIVAKT